MARDNFFNSIRDRKGLINSINKLYDDLCTKNAEYKNDDFNSFLLVNPIL